MTVTGTAFPASSKMRVIPIFLPLIPAMMDGSLVLAGSSARRRSRVRSGGGSGSVHLDLDVHSGGQVELGQRVDRLRTAVHDVDQALVRPQLELLAALLVHVGRAEHGPA